MNPFWLVTAMTAAGAVAGWTIRFPSDQSPASEQPVVSPPPVVKPVAENNNFSPSEELYSLKKFYDETNKASKEQLAALWDEVKTNEGAGRSLGRFLIVVRAHQENPSLLKEWCMDPLAGSAAIAAWVRVNANEVLTWASQIGDKNIASFARSKALIELSEGDPGAALASVGTQDVDPGVASKIFKKLALSDFSTATAQATVIPAGKGRVAALHVCGDVLARKDPTKAVAWARSLPDAKDQQAGLEGVLMTLSATDLSATLAAMKKGGAPAGKWSSELLSQVASFISKKDPMEAIAWLKDPANGFQQRDYIVCSGVMNNIPAPTVGFLAKTFTDDLLQQNTANGLSDYLTRWQPPDLGEAIREACTLGKSKATGLILWELFHNRLLKRDDAWTAELIATLPQDKQAYYLTLKGEELRREGKARELAELYAKLPTEAVRMEAFRLQAENFALAHPQKAAEFLDAVPQNYKLRAADNLAQGLAQNDYLAGEKLINSLPESAQADTYYTLANYAAQNNDSRYVSERVKIMTAGSAKDGAIAGLVDAIVDDDPAAAIVWASQTSNAKTRIHNLACTLNKIEKAEEMEKVGEAVQSLKLTAQEQADLTKRQAELKKGQTN